jgi:hypothetical protein
MTDPITASFTVAMDGETATVTDTSTAVPGTVIDAVSFTWSDGPATECEPGGSVSHTYPNGSQRKITQTVTGATTVVATSEKVCYPKVAPKPVSPPPPPVSPPPPPVSPPTQAAFMLQVMPTSALPDAVVTGTAGGNTISLTVKPGQRVPLVTGSFQFGSVVYYPDGCIEVENAYVGAGNPTPADLAINLHIVCGDQTWDSGAITVEYHCAPRPFWTVAPTLKPFNRSKFPHYAASAATISYAAAYAAADNSQMGPGLISAQLGNEGEHNWLGLLNAWDVPALDNPTPENLAVVLGMSDAGNVFPYRAIDTATNVMLDAYAYPKASMAKIYLGLAGNPFAKYTTTLPVNRSLDQVTGHAPSFHVAAAAMFQTLRHKAMLSQYTAYLNCWEANYAYRLPNGPVQFAATEGARGAAWTTRQLAQAAQFSDQPELFAGWLKLRIAELATVLGQAGPLPIINAWLVYPTNDSATGWGFAPWQVLDYLGQTLGYLLQLGYSDVQPVFDALAQVRLDSIDKCQHEFATMYAPTFCENGDRKNGAHAQSWGECLQFDAGIHPKTAAALACAEGSQALQDAYGTGNKAGDYFGYPASSTGYASIMQPMLAYMVDYYTPDPVRAQAVWTKFAATNRIVWDNPKYNIVPR